MGGVGAEDVVHEHQAMVAKAFDSLGEVAGEDGIGAEIEEGEEYVEVHGEMVAERRERREELKIDGENQGVPCYC
jgi:hypothetical protein